MLAASFWSLLEPSIDIASISFGALSFIPVSVGFVVGGLFVYLVDIFVPEKDTVEILIARDAVGDYKKNDDLHTTDSQDKHIKTGGYPKVKDLQWKRILLLIIAITVHNIPEGLAVGVGFGATATQHSHYCL
ncbi:zinc transporter ZIP11-like [Tropilaelaps mercedesae]|uniref:Zinc transporter ZIP11-like n=1 Tax=Tropilaelaps mercedesae TaxID=418985 RepID=A0A1V9XI70_9ACAR|nr:zinc transporter ZIP11-like [Tropilaelaps mercedesae]